MAYENPEQMIPRTEAAALLGRSEKTLRNWACLPTCDQPLRFFKLRGRVRYRVGDVLALRDQGDTHGGTGASYALVL